MRLQKLPPGNYRHLSWSDGGRGGASGRAMRFETWHVSGHLRPSTNPRALQRLGGHPAPLASECLIGLGKVQAVDARPARSHGPRDARCSASSTTATTTLMQDAGSLGQPALPPCVFSIPTRLGPSWDFTTPMYCAT